MQWNEKEISKRPPPPQDLINPQVILIHLDRVALFDSLGHRGIFGLGLFIPNLESDDKKSHSPIARLTNERDRLPIPGYIY